MNGEEEQIKALADNLWKYFEPKIKNMMKNNMSYFRAEVVSAPQNGKITIQKPFDNTTMTIPYSASAGSLGVGDQCTVLQMGGASNCIVAGDGMLSGL